MVGESLGQGFEQPLQQRLFREPVLLQECHDPLAGGTIEIVPTAMLVADTSDGWRDDLDRRPSWQQSKLVEACDEVGFCLRFDLPHGDSVVHDSDRPFARSIRQKECRGPGHDLV